MDLVTKARFKITLLYFLLGVIFLGIAGYFIYSDITAIVQNILQTIQNLLSQRVNIDQNTAAKVIAQSIDAQVRRMNFSIGFWLIIAMVLSAYWLAGITLKPVKRAMERQKRFMVNISHELRTPLSVMKTTTEATLLAANHLTQAELIESAASNLEELDRMARIIEFLLNFSNIENRLTRLTLSSVDIVESAKKNIELMRKVAEKKNISLKITGERAATVSGSATAIEEMILNLLKNAVAYTPQGGAITVAITKKFGSVILSIRDTGIGIPPEEISKIFEAFYQGNNVQNRKKEGSMGLGLAIVKEIATFHNAAISAKSVIGKGTTISIRFPGRFSRFLALS